MYLLRRIAASGRRDLATNLRDDIEAASVTIASPSASPVSFHA
jgi:hypothetical protein